VFRVHPSLARLSFWVSVRLGTLKDGGAVNPVYVQTTADGATDDVGDLRIEKGRMLAGRVVRSDGQSPSRALRLEVRCPSALGSLSSTIDDRGRFEFNGLPEGPVSLEVDLPNADERLGYQVSLKNKCLDPLEPTRLVGRLDHDVSDLSILIEPYDPSRTRDPRSIDPAILADFNDAKAGPITGVPPGDYPPNLRSSPDTKKPDSD
jgi:hypothetical protein